MAGRKIKPNVKKLVEDAEDQDWTPKPTSDGIRLEAPDGIHSVTVHLTESDHRSMRNTVGRMKRLGFKPRRRY